MADVVDLIDIDDFEAETQFWRSRNRQQRALEQQDPQDVPTPEPPVTTPDFTTTSPESLKTPTRKGATTARTTPGSRKKNPTKANTKKSAQKASASKYQGWRASQNFDVPPPTPTLTPKEKEKKAKEVEQKQIGERIKELAASVGWSQPNRHDQRTTKKNAEAVPYRYKQERTTACTICGDTVPTFEATKLKCKHQWCHACLQQNFQMVINDPASWPAKCCKPLDHEFASKVLSAKEFSAFLDIKREKEHLSNTSCYQCHSAIPSANIIGGSSAFCTACEGITCVHCTQAMHEGACLLDPETEKLMRMANGKRWSKCPNCSNMVERNTGCNSMMCRCGTNFCYKCGRFMSKCLGSGHCTQTNFQSEMWDQQAPHKPVQVNAATISSYRQISIEGEAALIELRDLMEKQNAEAREKQQLVTEIVTLRAKLEKKDDKASKSTGNITSSITASATPTPKTPEKLQKTLSGLEAYRKAYPALMKVLEDSPAHEKVMQPPSFLDKYREKFPALMKAYDEGKMKEKEMEEEKAQNILDSPTPIGTVDLTMGDFEEPISMDIWKNLGHMDDEYLEMGNPFDNTNFDSFIDREEDNIFSPF